MAKTPSTQLYDLIKSLSSSEKRYFKLYIKEESSSLKYITLFDAIDESAVFDEDDLKQKIYGKTKITSKKYSELKAYLHQLILKSLQAYTEKKSIDLQIKTSLGNIEVLFKRSLFTSAFTIISKTKKTALRYEKFKVLLTLLEWEKKVAYALSDIEFLDKEMPRITQEEQQYITQFNNEAAYQQVFFQMWVKLRKKPRWQTEEEREELKAVIHQCPPKPLSHQASIWQLRLQAYYYYAIGDFKLFQEKGETLIQLMESKPHLLKQDISTYIAVISNLSISGYLLKDYSIVYKCLDKLKLLDPITLDDKAKIHRQYYTNLFTMCIRSGDFKQGLEALNTHFKEHKQFNSTQFTKDSFYFQYFYIYFGNEMYEEALDALNQWLSLPRRVERQDMQNTSYLINLIVHFELENTYLLESIIRSTYRRLQKVESPSPIIKLALQFFKDIPKARNKKEEKQAFIKFQESLETSPDYRKVMSLFNFEAWLRSKIEGIPFALAIAEEFKQQK